MVNTRSTRAREIAKHSSSNDLQNMDNVPSPAKTTQDSPASFKAAMERFRHNEPGSQPESSTKEETEKQDHKPSRKRSSKPKYNSEPSDPTPTAKRRRKPSSKYAPPSTYAHLPPLTDILEPNLICVFVGTNPGIRTATAGHAYAHPSNLFWKLLHSSGCTAERLRPEQDVDLPRLYAMGNTNIVSRPSRDAGELSKAEMAAGTPVLEEKVARFRPEAVCIVGKGIWEAVWRWRYGREIKKDEFRYGWQEEREMMGRGEGWEGARVFVATSTSGLSASLRPHEKEAIWRPFGEWVQDRRREKAEEEEGTEEAADSSNA